MSWDNPVSPIDTKNSSGYLVHFFLAYPRVLGGSVNQAAAICFVKKPKVSDFGTSDRFFYQFTKPFHKFELLPGAVQ